MSCFRLFVLMRFILQVRVRQSPTSEFIAKLRENMEDFACRVTKVGPLELPQYRIQYVAARFLDDPLDVIFTSAGRVQGICLSQFIPSSILIISSSCTNCSTLDPAHGPRGPTVASHVHMCSRRAGHSYLLPRHDARPARPQSEEC